jgi:hypothetical protein
MTRNACYFIDADNAPNHNIPGCAIRALSEMTGTRPEKAVIAGITEARIKSWASVLLQHNESIVPELLQVQKKENAADVALIMAMGHCLERSPAGEVIFVLSADKLILQAAERLSELGFMVHAVVFGNVLQNTALAIHKIQLSFPELMGKVNGHATSSPTPPPAKEAISAEERLARDAVRGFFDKYPEKMGKSVTKSEIGGYMQSTMQISKADRTKLYQLIGLAKLSAIVFKSEDFE